MKENENGGESFGVGNTKVDDTFTEFMCPSVWCENSELQ